MSAKPALRLVVSNPDQSDRQLDDDLTEIAAGVADTAIEKCNGVGRAATANDVATICIHLFGHAVDKGAELREVIRRTWIMVAERQEAARLLVAIRPARLRRSVPGRRDQGGADQQLELEFGGAA